MGDEWKEWGVVENVSTPTIPNFTVSYDDVLDPKGEAEKRIRKEWDQFVELLNVDGPGAGYERLLSLQENMKARREEIAAELKKWEDRKERLEKLKEHYHLKLQDLAGVENPSAIWRTHGVTDIVEQLPDAVVPLADQPIVEAFVDFDDDGRLVERPELEGGWTARLGNITGSIHLDLADNHSPEPRRKNMTIRYRLSYEELERAGIDPENLDPFPWVIQMKPSTTWREALMQIEERKQEMKEKKERPERTLRVLDFRMGVLENVLYRFETFGSTETLTETDAQEIAEESQPGRKSTLNDPETHPSAMLKAVLEWTGDDANRSKPFRSENKPSLCGHVSKRLEEPAGYMVPQDTIKTRLRSIMDEMGVQLPHGPTNTLSYFEAREEITEAMKEHDLV